ncbi:MAG TPA: potassium-transporting ATPase subunit F [Acidimicrobiales bacterium]|nr:potassium-transporting ATPase subunit F [Acidimicrobiales bacterium]
MSALVAAVGAASLVDNLIALALTVIVVAYLVAVLVFPEKF